MENYIVSARKYRPTAFTSVIGQEHIVTTLKNAIANNHLAQALLFCGPRGVGKTTCARIVAKEINKKAFAEEGKEFDPEAAVNIFELDAASNNSVEDIRNLIDQVRYPPQYGKYKVYIIDEVHMLSQAAFNAFLKTLEEPPSYVIFILATTEKHKILPTILSRCQTFDFNRIGVEDVVKQLTEICEKENITADADALHLIGQKADGAMRDALSLFDMLVTFSTDNKLTYDDALKNLHVLDYDYYFKITEMLWDSKANDVLLIFDEILKKGFDAHNFIVGLCEHFRNLLMCKDSRTLTIMEVGDNVKKRYKDQASAITSGFILSALNLGNKCNLEYKSA
jgi:DNA polymerase-3 subunit gamma/tau